MHFPGGPAMAMPPNGTGLAGQLPQPPAPADAQNPGPASAAAPGATYEAKIEIAHKHAADAALRDAKRACQPGVNVPFADLDDAIARLLPYHVFSAADEDELDLSVVPPIREDDDAEKTSADAPVPARSRAQAWAESRAEFVRAFVRELASKRRRVEARDGGASGSGGARSETAAAVPEAVPESAREPATNERDPASGSRAPDRSDRDTRDTRGIPGSRTKSLSPAEEYLVAAKTLEVAKRRDAAERAARARAQAELRRQAEAERQKQQARARAEAEARRAAAQAEAEARRAAAASAAGDQSRAAAAVTATTATGETASERPAIQVAPGLKKAATENHGDAGARATAVGPAIVVRAPGANAPFGGSAKSA